MIAQGPQLTSDCSRGICERERGRKRGKEGGKAKAGRWFLREPEVLAPPSPGKVGDTFVAWAFLKRSCDFQDWELRAIRATRFVSAEP